ncbi:MAG: peptidoglycan DD-metalloendopeptidase family protein [Candidatus Paceibacterota bacterium]|jgi:murein DD-endopeptidase MepM/ murein hydrolase activator NlpD
MKAPTVKKTIVLGILAILCVSFSYTTLTTRETLAETAEQIQQKIDAVNTERNKLLAEIKQWEGKISTTGKELQTLQNALKLLDLSRSKLQTDLKLTEKNISSTNLGIQELDLSIAGKEEQIEEGLAGLSQSVRVMQQADDISLIETVLTKGTFSEVLTDIQALKSFSDKVEANLAELRTLRDELETQQNKLEGKKVTLLSLKSELSDKKKIADQNAKEKSNLLLTTKNKESEYKKQLAAKQAKKAALDAELYNYESQLKLAIDFNKIPKFGSGVLSMPLSVVRITQTFGDTEFSRTHAGVYNGNGHNGIDFGASLGTPVKSAGDGVIVATGDTDVTCAGASYGKWVFIKHNNGLSTLYAHLSLIKAITGSTVKSGDVIGYSGNTGYSTGPHLHFTVYASDGVKVTSLKSKACSGTYTMPVADLRAYLNPLLYL